MSFSLHRALRGALPLLAVCALNRPAAAQRPRLAPEAIGQIVDAVLNQLIPPDTALSRIPMSKRTILFDGIRTMKAFGYSGASDSVAALRLRTPVVPASESVLADCSQGAPRPCSRLGWGVYVSVKPVSITGSRACVYANFAWADRGGLAFEEGVAPAGPAYLVGFSSEVFLVRAPDGRWKFERIGRTLVS